MIKYFIYHIVFFVFVASTRLSAALQVEADVSLMQSEIKHVVVLMLENRSFDNVLGWLYDVNDPTLEFLPADADPHFYGLSEDILAKYTNTLKNSAGEVVFSCPPIKGVPSIANSKFINSPKFDPHEPFSNVTTQIFGIDGNPQPNMLGFLQDFATLWPEDKWLDQKLDICAVMETYTEKELPVLHGLAKRYAICDMWFSSVPTQTNPNRAFSLCGTSEGEIVNGPLALNVFRSDTIWNRLHEQSPATTWMVFWQGDMLPGIKKGCYSGVNTFAALKKIPQVDDHFQKFDRFHELARNGQLPDFTFLEPLWTISENISSTETEIDDLICGPDYLIIGVQGNDLHPPGEVRTCENLLANIYTSLIANPEAWEKTLFIITFDEHGGLFDHIPPPAVVAPDDCCQEGFKFDRLGVRIPTIFISPKINKGVVVRAKNPEVPFDHTSTLATILKWKNVDPAQWNLGARVAVASTFEHVLGRTDPRQDYVLVDDNVTLPCVKPENVVKMGDKFYLKDRYGSYLTLVKNFIFHEKAVLEFFGGSGKITHGSFALLKANAPFLDNQNFLETSLSDYDCHFAANNHSSGQWWTIKSVDTPYVGMDIQFGDKIYLENHIYLDLFQYVPCRLTQTHRPFANFLRTKTIVESGSDSCYWTIERI